MMRPSSPASTIKALVLALVVVLALSSAPLPVEAASVRVVPFSFEVGLSGLSVRSFTPWVRRDLCLAYTNFLKIERKVRAPRASPLARWIRPQPRTPSESATPCSLFLPTTSTHSFSAHVSALT